MFIETTLCDHCGTIISGKEGGAWVNRDYISMMDCTLHSWSEKYNTHLCVYGAKKGVVLTFCTLECFDQHLKNKKATFEPKIISELEARRNWQSDADKIPADETIY